MSLLDVIPFFKLSKQHDYNIPFLKLQQQQDCKIIANPLLFLFSIVTIAWLLLLLSSNYNNMIVFIFTSPLIAATRLAYINLACFCTLTLNFPKPNQWPILNFKYILLKKYNNDIATFCKPNGINPTMTSKYFHMLCQGRQQCSGYLLEWMKCCCVYNW